MARGENLLGKIFQRRVLKRWSQSAKKAKSAELHSLGVQRENARELRDHLNEVIHVADQRFAMAGAKNQEINHPKNASWVWRPSLWSLPLAQHNFTHVKNQTKIGDEAEIFHNCNLAELSVRQLRNNASGVVAKFAAQIEVFKFEGSFLSLVLDLPNSAIEGLKKRHILRLDADVLAETPSVIFARLNVKHGPNTEQIVQELSAEAGAGYVEFDLAFTGANERRIEKLWLDLIFENPGMNQITIRDLTMYRYPRAEL